MPLQPQVRQLLDGMAAMDVKPVQEMTPVEVRESFAALDSLGAASAPDVPTTEASVAGPGGDIAVRVYDPVGTSPDGPTLVWYHGGGWVIGDLGSADATCRHLAVLARVRVVSVDYRLAPEHRYPAAIEDALAAFEAVADGKLGGPPSVVAVGGDSAGGNLAAVVSLMARDQGARRPAFQLLVYPVTDSAMDTASYRDNADGYFLTRAAMEWFFGHYTGSDPEVGASPCVSPLRAPSLEDLPPAHVVTAEYDPLRDEGAAYADRLRQADVAVTHQRCDGQIHGFFGLVDLCGPTARQAMETAAAELRRALT